MLHFLHILATICKEIVFLYQNHLFTFGGRLLRNIDLGFSGREKLYFNHLTLIFRYRDASILI